MMFQVLVPQPIAEEGIELMKKHQCQVIELQDPGERSLRNAVVSADAVLIRTAPLTESIIESADKLKVIARHGVGVDNIDLEAAEKKGVKVCNAPTANSNAVAEHVVGMIFNLSRHIVQGDNAVRDGEFSARHRLIGMELKGKTLGLIGCGNIGRLVADKCHSLGMLVEVYDPYVKELPPEVKQANDMSSLLQKADYISLHLPLTSATQYFINEEKLNLMKPSAFLINAARGGIVNENALYQALKTKSIAGAALDCFEEEPVQPGNPLWELDNTLYTPHMAAHTREAMVSMAVEAAQEIIRVKEGNTPLNLVNNEHLHQ
ncbi:hydroxyacid dehydrogenase [Salibacterium aidingense]|uniref:hydroxyacid dehydrogenase n=1 Tax=Salibacterium aidingense TaxID=384933 RepID=UPI003BE3376D